MRIFSTARVGSGSLAVLIGAAGVVIAMPATVRAQPTGASPTFTKDVAPILQRSCQSAIVPAPWRRCRC